ncbi:amidophosphoribosyltransferase [Criibacterium bergeronii]|uniref:Amidophosphoribosyltransferase n=1 Tax=Criibacterium bergeronii TaxID=1871336 RepID=A0A552V8M1_9FIRM|nr:amidophosphoribosyltransferase [Criibacterium bergeronii]TRW26818.1 amidophosphoribosyltransferase [Criibacterium bergeronii]
MGGFFGAACIDDVIEDIFYGADYHSHLATKSAGVAVYDKEIGLQRNIHNMKNTSFRIKFEHLFKDAKGNTGIGCINDTDPQPLLIRSSLGQYAICTLGQINNAEELIKDRLSLNCVHFDAMTGGRVNTTELVATLINQKESFKEGIEYAQDVIDGSLCVLILTDHDSIIAARDKFGRLPVLIGKSDRGYSVAFENFSYKKLGYEDEKELGPGEIVEFTKDSLTVLAKAKEKLSICSFLWTYYGYPTSTYEGVNVEVMRYKNGAIMAQNDKENLDLKGIDFVGGVPDSGTPHAMGYAHTSNVQFVRAFIKYTPTWSRSFIPPNQSERNVVAKMKQIPVYDLIKDKNLLFVDDSIVRGTQLKGTVDFLYTNGAKSVHMRSACPPIMYSCKFLNFSRSNNEMELLTRRTIMDLEGEEGFNHIAEYIDGKTERGKRMRNKICENLHLASLEFQTMEGLVKSIGLSKENLCTYCFDKKE